ncbi:MAG: hypothetical protein ACKVQU_06505 [Burkholderiales bacterium]
MGCLVERTPVGPQVIHAPIARTNLDIAQPTDILLDIKSRPVFPSHSPADTNCRSGAKMQQPISTIGLVLYGFLTWLVPFAVSVLMMTRDGQPVLPIGTFKSLTIVVGSAVGAWLLVRVFRRRPIYKPAGLVVGLLWIGINIGLDLLILLPMTKMSLPDYFGDIALRYLVIPIMAPPPQESADQVGRRGPTAGSPLAFGAAPWTG